MLFFSVELGTIDVVMEKGLPTRNGCLLIMLFIYKRNFSNCISLK